MYVSTRWLGLHVDLSGLSPQQICDDLSLSTAEVEGLERFAPHLSEVVVGHVLERAKHPEADNLSVCRVDVGRSDPLTIVCGAGNVAAGQKVAVATVGTTLPGDFKIKKSKIRGVASEGMICSVSELALGDEHSGIWVLPAAAPVGIPVAEALGLDDWVIEIDNKSLTHRPDLWGHRGLAAEIAAIHSRALKPLDETLPATGPGSPFPVRIEASACTRYVALAIDGAQAGPSPDWLRGLLLAVRQRPIDVIVDLSNFVMLDLGQPNHVFDRGRLSPQGIVVRAAHEGESLRTLDGEERKLRASDLLICSGPEPVALAGILGGEASKVSGDSRELLLEVAHFEPAGVRRTSSRLGLRTDSSARFEKHLDPTLPLRAAARFARLLQELQPGVRFPAPATDAGNWRDPARVLRLRCDRLRRELGKDIPDAEIRDILTRLGFHVEKVESAPHDFHVHVPSSRASKDITIERDLVEEVGRIHRYGNIPERAMTFEIAPPPRDERRLLVRRIQDRLAGGARFHEVLSYSFVEDALLARLGQVELPYVRVINPVVQGQDKVRRSVLPSLLADLEKNRRERDDVRLFEIGKGYLPEHANERGEPAERHLLALVWAGRPPARKAAFEAGRLRQLQGVLTDLSDHLGLARLQWSRDPQPASWAHPGKALVAGFEGQAGPALCLAELEPGVARALGLREELASDVAAAEVDLDRLLAAPLRARRYQPIPRFPGTKLDVAVSLPEATPASAVESAIEKAGKGLVARSELFDLYRGDNIGAGRKSLAYHLLLQSESRTLGEQDEQKFLKRFEQLLAEIGAELRRG